MLTFGERLRLAREAKGLKQSEVYKITNINNKSLSRYENDTTTPDPEAIKTLIELYQVSASFILGLTDDMKQINLETEFDEKQFWSELKQMTSTLSNHQKKLLLEFLRSFNS